MLRSALLAVTSLLAGPGLLTISTASYADDAAPKVSAQSATDVDKLPLATLAKQFPDIRGVGGIFIFNPDTDNVPPSSDPRDLNGMWRLVVGHQTLRPEVGARPDGFAPYTTEAERIVLDRLRKAYLGTPVAETAVYCEPVGVVRHAVHPLLLQFLQTPDRLFEVWEEYQEVREIHMNQQHPKHITPSYDGHAVGHWEADTLVIDTVGFNAKTWLDRAGSPHGPRLHLVERIRKLDGGTTIEDQMTIEDPDFYTQPFTERMMYKWRPDWRMPERNCEEAMRSEIENGLIVQ
jgi:hypothetical protein